MKIVLYNNSSYSIVCDNIFYFSLLTYTFFSSSLSCIISCMSCCISVLYFMRINCREMERVGTVSDLYPQQSIKTSSHV